MRRVKTLELLRHARDSSKYPKALTNMMKSTTKRLRNEERIGRRKKSMRRPRILDEIDERFILDCIENKSTAHGRRHDAVMYTNHRVKKRDFKRIANYSRVSRGLNPIKSSTTVFNRGRPHNEGSKQAQILVLGFFVVRSLLKLVVMKIY